MKENSGYLVLLAVLTALLLASAVAGGLGQSRGITSGSSDPDRPGRLDLSAWSMSQSPSVALRGTWLLRYGDIVDPAGLPRRLPADWGIAAPVPAAWNDLVWRDQPIGSTGRGTYLLDIVLPPGVYDLALDFRMIRSASEIWADGVLLHRAGQISRSDEEREIARKRLPPLPVPRALVADGALRLVVLTSNFNNYEGGFFGAPVLGDRREVVRAAQVPQLVSGMTIGAFVLILVYSLLVMPGRSGLALTAAFGLFMIAVIARTLCVSEFIFLLLPELDDDLADRIEYAATFPMMAAYLYVLDYLFPQPRHGLLRRGMVAAALAWLVLVAVTPPLTFSTLSLPSLGVALVCVLYILGVLGHALLTRREGAPMIAAGIAIMVLFFVHDALIYVNVIDAVDISYFGSLAFIIAHGIVLSGRIMRTFREVSRLSEELQTVNLGLEREVAARTRELREKTAILETSMESMNSGFIAVGADGRIQAVNSAFSRLLGLARPVTPGGALEGLNRQLGELWERRPDAPPLLLADPDRPARQGRDLERPGGGILEEQVSSNRDGGHVGIYSDVTAAREGRQVYRGGEIVTWEFTLADGHLHLHDRFWQVLHHAAPPPMPETPAGAPPVIRFWLGLAHPEDRHGLEELLAGALQGGTRRFSKLMRVRRGDGGWMWCLCRGRLVRDGEAPSAQRLVGMLCDIDELVRLEIALREAKAQAERQTEEKTRLLATLSHEIRTPLNGMLGLVRLIEGDNLTGEQRRALARINQAGLDMSGLVNAILDLSRHEILGGDRERQPTRAGALVREICDLFEGEARDRDLALTVLGPDDDDPELAMNRRAVRQILVNLISNALKHGGGGDVVVEVGVSPVIEGLHELRVEVIDRGPGIDPALQADLFSEFVRGEKGGAGLGLYIARRLARGMSGDVTLVSRQDEGSRFALELSLSPADGEEEPEALPAHLAVLLIEDEPSNRDVAKAVLQSFGQAVTLAGDGAEALACLRDQAFDVVLMDMHLPDMDGFELLARLRRLPSDGGEPPAFVATTGAAGLRDEGRYRDAGFAAVIAKPWDPAALLAVLADAVRQPDRLPLENGRPSSEPIIVRLKVLEESLGLEALIRLIEDYRRSLDELQASLVPGLRDGPPALAADLLHRMASGAANFGLQEFAAACESQEIRLRHLEGMDAHLGDDVLAKLQDPMRRDLDRLAKQVERLAARRGADVSEGYTARSMS